MTIKNPKRRNDYIGTGLLDTYVYEYRTKNIADFLIIETTIATGVEKFFDSTGDLDGTVGIVGSGSDYEMTGLKDENGGTGKRIAGVLPDTLELAIILNPLIVQDTPIRQLGDGHRARLEDEIDRSRQIDLAQQDLIDACLKLKRNIDPSTVNMEIVPSALKFLQWNSDEDAIQNGELGALDAIVLPGSPGMAAYLGGTTFASRTLTGSDGITVTDGDGASGAPDISGLTLETDITAAENDITSLEARADLLEEQLTGQEQSTPDDTVFMTAGQVNDLTDPTAKPVDVAANAASAITFGPTTPGNSRIDLMVIDRVTGVYSKVVGVNAASPTVPAYPIDKWVRCELTIDETGTVVINNADIRNVNSYLDYSSIQGTIDFASGAFTSDGTDNRTIATGIPTDATLLEVRVQNKIQIVYSHWHLGDATNHISGAGIININANATTSFDISGTDFIVGNSGTNVGATAAGWIVKFRRASS